jgi:hypothetical protein
MNAMLRSDGLIPKYISNFPTLPAFNTSTSCVAGVPRPNDYPNTVWYISNGTDYKVQFYNISGLSQRDYAKYPEFIDPANDGGPIDPNYCYFSPSAPCPDGQSNDRVHYLTSCNNGVGTYTPPGGSGDGTNYHGLAIYSPGYRCAP